MPQLCTVCTHPQHHEIDLAVIRGERSNRDIARQFGITHAALHRHRVEHLTEKILQSQAVATKIETIDLNRELATLYQHVRTFFDSCHEQLLDPDDPTKYYVGPRSEEVTVIYDEEEDDGERKRRKRRKARLNTLLKKLEDGLGFTVVGYDIRQADVRVLYLNSAKQLMDEIHRIGEKLGLFAPAKLDPDLLESLRNAVHEMIQSFKAEFNKDMSWEDMIDRIIHLHPSKRAYLEKLRAEGPELPGKPRLTS